MKVLKFDVKGQKIERDKSSDFDNIVRGTDNYIQLVFMFDSEWNGLRKVISLFNSDGEEENFVLYNNKISLNKNITKGSLFGFRIYGSGNDRVIKTEKEYVEQK